MAFWLPLYDFNVVAGGVFVIMPAYALLAYRVPTPYSYLPDAMFIFRIAGMFSVAALIASQVAAADPLHRQIDKHIESHATFVKSAAPVASDATFLRRVYLDLVGTIPAAAQVDAFLQDTSPGKRGKLIDTLLGSPAHARRMQYVFDEILMERKPGKHVPAGEWQQFLRQSFEQNKPYNQLIQEMLTVDGSDKKTRAAAKFLLDRELRTDEVTRDLGRIFLGRDLQCAQCHDHPSVDDYHQVHYHGLTAFLNRSYLFKDPKTGLTSIGEKAEGGVQFTSVFTAESGSTAPRMLNLPPLEDPPKVKEPYKVKRSKTTKSVPVYSRRLKLAPAMTSDSNQAFRLNIANRMWAMMMGRGLVEPLDMMHSDNPPSHPQLLDVLASSLLQHNYDLRFLLREIALSTAYQRSTQATAETPPAATYSTGLLKPLSPEQLASAMMQATGAYDSTVYITGQPDAADKAAAKLQAKQDATALQHTAAFVKVFGSGGQTTRFDAAAGQALFLRNDSLIQTWLASKGGLVDQLQPLDEKDLPAAFYLAVFSRQPTPQESASTAKYIASKKDRRKALMQLTWAAMVSVEFRFNH